MHFLSFSKSPDTLLLFVALELPEATLCLYIFVQDNFDDQLRHQLHHQYLHMLQAVRATK